MRLIRTTYIIAICIVTWIIITYLAFSNQSLSAKNGKNYEDDQITTLEKRIAAQFDANNKIIHAAHKYLEQKGSLKIDLKKPDSKLEKQYKGTVIPVLVLACNRISVNRCLQQLIKYRPNPDQFPIIVSQVSNFYFQH